MKVYIAVGLLFFIVQSVVAQDVLPSPAYDNVTITLSGKIVDELTNTPVGGAVVRVAAVNQGAQMVAGNDDYAASKITAQDGSSR